MIAWNRNGSTLHHYDVSVMPWPIETGSVQCCVTSPPYLHLRSYAGVEPAIWGGSALCEHDWQAVWTPNQNAGGGITFKQSTNPGSYQCGGPKPVKDDGPRGYENAFCPRCSAWKGTLGNENLHDCLAWARREPPCNGCYICRIRMVLAELARVLRPDGTVWWNIGESMAGSGGSGGDYSAGGSREGQPRFAGSKKSICRSPDPRHDGAPVPSDKSEIGIPARTMLAAQADGWIIRSEIIWWKRNGLCSSAKDRPNNRHETIILMTRSPRYHFNESESGGSNVWGTPPDVWDIPTEPSSEEHYAGFPSALVRRCLAGGGPEHGCCSRCGKPFERLIEKGEPDRKHQKQCGGGKSGEYTGQATKDFDSAGVQNASDVKRRILRGMVSKRLIGWSSACDCNAGDPVPCTVFDPFTGSGTTGIEAIKAGYQFVGLEASEKYCGIAARRLEAVSQQPVLPIYAGEVEYRQAEMELFEAEAING